MADVNANIGVNIDSSQALAELKMLQRQLAEFNNSIAKSNAAAAAAQKSLQKNLVSSINSIGAFSAELRTVKTTAESFTHSLENNKFSMREYFRYAAASTKTFGNTFKSEFDTIGKVAEERVKKLQTQYIKMGRDASGAMKAIAVTPTHLDLSQTSTQLQVAAQKQAIFNQLLKQGSTNLLNFGKNTQWAGRQLMVGFTLPLAAFGATAARAFQQLETEVIKFKKVYGDLGTSQAETEAALKNIQNLADGYTKYGVEVSKTVGVASAAAAAGFKNADLIAQTDAATKLAILGQIDQQQALETTISLQNAFKISSTELASTIDFLNAVENQTVTSLDDITTAIPKVAPVIQQLGGDVKDLAFFLTAMKEGGVNAAEGANALKSGLASLINPSKKANDMLSGMGININNIVTKNRGNLKATVVEFAKELDKLDPLSRARAIETMFGKFQFARISTLLSNVTQTGNQAAKVLDLAGQSASSLANLTTKELGITAESALVKFQGSMAKLKASLAPVGEVFMKAFVPVLDFISGLLDKFNGLGDGTKKFIAITVGVIGGLGPILLMTFGLLANGLANIFKLFATLRAGYQRLTGKSQDLGRQTQYLTMEQMDAAAAAHSLEQSHAKLTQQFNVEATAVNQLRTAYQNALAAGASFASLNPGMMRLPKKKFASGGIIKGPGTGISDSIPAMVSNGEAIIPEKTVRKYPGLVNGLVTGNLPRFADGKISLYPEYAIRLQNAKENMGQRSGTTDLPSVLSPLAMRLGESRGIAPTQRNLRSGQLDKIYKEFEDLTTKFVDRVNVEYDTTYKDIEDANERMQKSWTSAGKSVEKEVNSIKSDAERGVIRKTFGLSPDEYGTIPTDSREAGGTVPNRGRRGAFKSKLTGWRSYTAIRPGAKTLYERMTGKSAANLQMGHVFGPQEVDISTLQNDPRKSGAVAQAANVLARGKKDGAEYQKGVEQSTKDPYVAARDRRSPHRLAPQDGRDDAIAYSNAADKELTQRSRRRVATRAQGPAAIGTLAPAGTKMLPIVAPLTTKEKFANRFQNIKSKVMQKPSFEFSGKGMGVGMGLMAGSMALNAAPDFANKEILQASMNLASMGAMFGPWGAAAGAAIGAVGSKFTQIIEKQKAMEAGAKAAFQSSASVANFFGNEVVNVDTKLSNFNITLADTAGKLKNVSSSATITAQNLQDFKDMVDGLSDDDPLKVVVEGLKAEDNVKNVQRLTTAFVQLQIATGQLKPEQGQQLSAMLLNASGHAAAAGLELQTVASQAEAVSLAVEGLVGQVATIYNQPSAGSASEQAAADAEAFTLVGETYAQLIASFSNLNSLEDLQLALAGLENSSISAAYAMEALRATYDNVGNYGSGNVVRIVESIEGSDISTVAAVQEAIRRGVRLKIGGATTLKDLQDQINEGYAKLGSSAFSAGKKAETASDKAISKNKKEISSLQAKKDALDKIIKKEQTLADHYKKQNDYLNKQQDLAQKIAEARMSGNYLEAANLEQQQSQNTVEYKYDEMIANLTAQKDAIDLQIKALEDNNAALTANTQKLDNLTKKIDLLKPKGGIDVTDPALAQKAVFSPVPEDKISDGGTTYMTYLDPSGVKVQDKIEDPSKAIDYFNAMTRLGYTFQRYTKKGDKGPINTIDVDLSDDPIPTATVKRAYGGHITGAGTSTSDSIPAYLSNGEYVVKASAVKQYGTGFLDSVNAQRFATGGTVGKKPKAPTWEDTTSLIFGQYDGYSETDPRAKSARKRWIERQASKTKYDPKATYNPGLGMLEELYPDINLAQSNRFNDYAKNMTRYNMHKNKFATGGMVQRFHKGGPVGHLHNPNTGEILDPRKTDPNVFANAQRGIFDGGKKWWNFLGDDFKRLIETPGTTLVSGLAKAFVKDPKGFLAELSGISSFNRLNSSETSYQRDIYGNMTQSGSANMMTDIIGLLPLIGILGKAGKLTKLAKAGNLTARSAVATVTPQIVKSLEELGLSKPFTPTFYQVAAPLINSSAGASHVAGESLGIKIGPTTYGSADAAAAFTKVINYDDLQILRELGQGEKGINTTAEALLGDTHGFAKWGGEITEAEVTREIFGAKFARSLGLLAPENTPFKTAFPGTVHEYGVFSRDIAETNPGSMIEKALIPELNAGVKPINQPIALYGKDFETLGMAKQLGYRDAIMSAMGYGDTHSGNLVINPTTKQTGMIDLGRIGESNSSLPLFYNTTVGASKNIRGSWSGLETSSGKADFLDGLLEGRKKLQEIKPDDIATMLKESGYASSNVPVVLDIYSKYIENTIKAINSFYDENLEFSRLNLDLTDITPNRIAPHNIGMMSNGVVGTSAATGGWIDHGRLQVPKFHNWNGVVPGPYGQELNAVLKSGTEGVYQNQYIAGLRNAAAGNTSTSNANTVYNIDMTINGGNSNANDIADQVMRKLKLVASQNNKSNKVVI